MKVTETKKMSNINISSLGTVCSNPQLQYRSGKYGHVKIKTVKNRLTDPNKGNKVIQVLDLAGKTPRKPNTRLVYSHNRKKFPLGR
jgi:hypothetical protein